MLMPVRVIARQEMEVALRDRWLLAIGMAFTALILGSAALALAGAEIAGLAAFDRSAAALVNLTVLFIPLLGLGVGAGSIAGERESGALGVLLAQPVSRGQVFAGKYAGVASAVCAAILLGYGLAGIALSMRAGTAHLAAYLTLAALSALLGLAMAGVGLAVSAVASNRMRALGAALVLWLALVLLSDLGILATAVVARVGVGTIFWLAMLNPVDVYRVAAILATGGSPDLTGPVGLYAAARFGAEGLQWVLTGLLAAWALAAAAAGLLAFTAQRGME
ncbi:MAG: ABC transporter permease [Armatimonadetes bacterium]|nr:ABC transporter permease [Armatimonadota bacterium]